MCKKAATLTINPFSWFPFTSVLRASEIFLPDNVGWQQTRALS